MIIQMGSTLLLTGYNQEFAGDYPLGDLEGAWSLNADGTVFFEGELEYDAAIPMYLMDTPFMKELHTMYEKGVRGSFTIADSLEETVSIFFLSHRGVSKKDILRNDPEEKSPRKCPKCGEDAHFEFYFQGSAGAATEINGRIVDVDWDGSIYMDEVACLRCGCEGSPPEFLYHEE